MREKIHLDCLFGEHVLRTTVAAAMTTILGDGLLRCAFDLRTRICMRSGKLLHFCTFFISNKGLRFG